MGAVALAAGAVADPSGARAATVAPSSALPSTGDIEAAAEAVGDHYLSAFPCGASGCAINNKWDNGVLMMGVVEHWRTYGDASYLSYARTWADRNRWTLFSNTSGNDQENPNWNNRMTAGYAYLRLLQAGVPGATVADVTANLEAQLGLPIAPERTGLVNYVFPGSSKGSLSWKYVDANFTALPVWIAMGRQTGDTRYYDRVRDLQDYQADVLGLQDPGTKLWFQHEAAKTKVTPNGLPVIWGRGNGWMAAGLASTLTELPAGRPEYAAYRARFTDLVQALRTRQRADGFWNMNLADPADRAAPETSATALITFAIARGIELGILDRATYAPVAAKSWNAIVGTAIAGNGRLGFCQGVGGQTFPNENATAEYNFCVGALLLAGTALNDIAGADGARLARSFQAEALPTRISSRDTQTDVSNPFADGGRANLARLNAAGDFVEFTAAGVPGGSYDLRVKVRLSPTGGIWQLRTNGADTGPRVDSYDVAPTTCWSTSGR